MRFWSLLLPVAGIVMLSQSASSQPASRCDAEYLDGFDIVETSEDGSRGEVTWEAPEIECVEHFRFTFSTPNGPRVYRAIGDVNVEDTLRPGDMDRIEDGARRAAAELASLGDYEIDNVTVLISEIGADPFAEEIFLPSGRRKHEATTGWTWDAETTPRDECPITLFVMNRFDGEDLQYTVAHETFHCVEYASLEEAQMWSGAVWWIEGAADLFAALVVADKDATWDRAPEFRAAVERQSPLYAMSYEAAVFFYWYYEHEPSGAGALMPFLHSMARSRDEAAQRAAIRAALSDEELLTFAEAFDDGEIRYPRGDRLDFGAPIDGTRWSIETTSTQRALIKPFVIMPGWTDYACGVWGNELAPDPVNLEMREEDSRDWARWPSETDCRDRGSVRYRTIAMHSGDANADLSLRAERRIACENCLSEVSRIDRCMVGTWRQTGGGVQEWLRALGMPIPFSRPQREEVTISLRDNGTFTGNGFDINYQLAIPSREGTIYSDARGGVAGTAGRWSAERGLVRACFDSGGQARATATTQYPDGNTYTGPFSSPGVAGDEGGARYTCSDTTLTTTVSTGRAPLQFIFTRVSPPPSR